MGLGTFVKKKAINAIAGRHPVLQKLVRLLVDTPAAKRTTTAVLAVTAVVLRHLGPMFGELCDKGYTVACSFRGIAVFGAQADQVAIVVDKLLVPGLDLATLILGIVGLAHAWARR